MPSSDKPKKQAKPQQKGVKKEASTSAKRPSKPLAAKDLPANTAGKTSKSVVKTAAGMVAGAVMSSDMLKSLLSNMLYDLLKTGWLDAVPALADVVHKLPLLQFSALRSSAADTAEEPGMSAAYEAWLDAVVSVALHLRRRTVELRQMCEEWQATYKEIADFAAERLADAVAENTSIEVETLMFDMRAYFHHRHLQAVVGPGAAADRRGTRL